MLFYFTATGNCLYVARELAREGEEVLSVAREMRRDGELAYADDAIGIVYPIYGHMMPTMVRQFVERSTFDTPYLYFVLTYGNRRASAAELCERDARAAGLDPAYIATLLMVDNWLPSFDMDEQRACAGEKHIDEGIARIRADVSRRLHRIEPVTEWDRAAHEQFLSTGLSFTPDLLDGFLAIDRDRCVGCGICARVCPADCISLEGGAAVRDARAGLGCNACLACIHACPAGAISLPGGEKNPGARFRNEHVTLDDLQRANG